MEQSTVSQEQVIENLSNKSNWMRLIYMLIFGVALHIAGIVMWLLCTVQFVITMLFGQDNANLRNMAVSIIEYINQALLYVSYNSEEKPFPFANQKQDHGDKGNIYEPSEDASTRDNATETSKEAMLDVDAEAKQNNPTEKNDDKKPDL